jgi:16S rRNA C967 or C1407 C5-methylase (RsmB/RsmF family)/NOL1/NOP2/fmu family ribosome biogenesis protein
MAALLGGETDAFLDSYRRPPARGTRANTRKTTRAELATVLGREIDPVPWCPTGLQLPADIRLGDHLAHRAGLCYLQEPSAMGPAEALGALPGGRVIDLAAAPGGKTTRLSELVEPGGVVVANEIDRRRLTVLQENLDRYGADNVVTCSHRIDRLADLADGAFDAALLDAPCSGEGLFRRDPSAIREWSPEAVQGASRRQAVLLEHAARTVRPGGLLVYSTCTFSVEENEERVAVFLAENPDWDLDDATTLPGFRPGFDVPETSMVTHRTGRLWPHHVTGEGQFVARMRRRGDQPASEALTGWKSGQGGTSAARQVMASWSDFALHGGLDPAMERVLVRGDHLFRRPVTLPPIPPDQLNRPGLPLGRARPGRFHPAQALAGSLDRTGYSTTACWPVDDPRWESYLSGAEVRDNGPDGWVLVCAYGWGVGWARRRSGVLKNYLPHRLRQFAARRRTRP